MRKFKEWRLRRREQKYVALAQAYKRQEEYVAGLDKDVWPEAWQAAERERQRLWNRTFRAAELVTNDWIGN